MLRRRSASPCAAPSHNRCQLPATSSSRLRQPARIYFFAYLSGFLTTPWLSPGGGRGMTPACPSSRATVCDGCAPTDSQYLRQADRLTDRQDEWAGVEVGLLAACDELLQKHRHPSKPDSSGGTHCSRSMLMPSDLLPSLPAKLVEAVKQAVGRQARMYCCMLALAPSSSRGAAAARQQQRGCSAPSAPTWHGVVVA